MELSLTRAPLRRRSGTEPYDGLLPRADPRCRCQIRFTYHRKTNNKLSVATIIVAETMASAVPASSRRVGSRARCFRMTQDTDLIAAKSVRA
jgi:hypothetical protein